jgi:hypothetical protein
MDLARAASRFTNSPIQAWDGITQDWISTPHRGALQGFDRFVTERTFGQKKRIMLVGADDKLDPSITVLRLEGSEEAFLVEKFNEDVRFGKVYGYTYLIHEGTQFVDLMKNVFTTNAAGAKIAGAPAVLESLWIDIDRFSAAPSKKLFEETEYTVVSMTFPRDSLVDTDCHVRIKATGERYNVDELYYSLDLKSAYGKRIGM